MPRTVPAQAVGVLLSQLPPLLGPFQPQEKFETTAPTFQEDILSDRPCGK